MSLKDSRQEKSGISRFFYACIIYLQEPGRYFFGIGFAAAGLHLHSVIVTPGEAVRSAVPATNGDNEIAFALDSVSPFNVVSLPATVITPADVTLPEATNFVGENAQVPAKSSADDCELCTLADTAVRHDDAAKITSDTLARIV